ncbi:mitochondrial genome maintenance protein Mgm101p [[Candida] anglica]|uniref:Mitochondrial genome maintenance protein MGM101 n=1 Tax=[Candida] anglica TaxID=148631 RepID=A0ABP0EEF4_9ASCO
MFNPTRSIGRRCLSNFDKKVTTSTFKAIPKKTTTFVTRNSSTTTPKSVSSTTSKENSPAPSSTLNSSSTTSFTPTQSTLTSLKDAPATPIGTSTNLPTESINWSESFHGLGTAPFSKEASDVLLAPLDNEDIEIKPDGLLYLPEIKYRRILNRAFGPGGWGLAPRTESLITQKLITREYALICHGRLVSVARGEQDYFGGEDRIPTALEGCKSNALMRCCKDLGIASELWDPSFIRKWKAKYADEVFAEHVVTKKKKKLWKLKSNKVFDYPYKQC